MKTRSRLHIRLEWKNNTDYVDGFVRGALRFLVRPRDDGTWSVSVPDVVGLFAHAKSFDTLDSAIAWCEVQSYG